ncbi:DUF1489 family protein [uncultured Bartonella sp.]|uniref:DUF1489 family protein n=1 Tax=uncultured Bartonella sp. TaxID=104108 RepID=UPI00261A0975|nr:DUF1489 family protein [uncultured Bartonella sp.]
MTIHLVKMCVGCSSIEELASWIDYRLEELRVKREKPEQYHVTRMVPKRIDELLDDGSLYWVMKGNIQCRQKLLDIRPFTDIEGIHRCKLVLEPKIIPTVWQPKRAFQGWRYLKTDEAPADDNSGGENWLPAALKQDLADLGLL